ncbi:hypothetical protein KY284_037208 [Solanum tuberosum]|nr:hypothetical protein KY284_037208 [Solanum tuberosum]
MELGKTTLAKILFRHVRQQFECSGMVYVSQQPRVGEILHDIGKQVGKENLEGNLRSLLKIKSRIIITSRNSNVGRYIGDSSLCVLQPLDSDNSFELFSKKIFNFDNNNNWANASPELVDIGRSIVGRCGGIPLAIVVTAGMLTARERTECAWNRVLESMGHKIQDGCAKDHEIRAFDLTNMWIAEKLIVVNSGNRREAESLAEDILNDLVSRNLIQVAKMTYDGRISSCRIHDLLHSLCVDLAKESNFFHTEHNAFGDPGNVARVLWITFYSDDNAMNEFFHLNPKPTKLRSLFCFTKDCCIFSQMAHLNFKLLQVDVSGSTIKILSALSPMPKALEVLKLRFFKNTSEQINLSSHPNIVELGLFGFSAMLLNIEAFPPNLVKLNLVGLMVDGHPLAVLKKLPKLRILKMVWCKYNEEKMDLSGDGDSFPQLEVLHIKDARGLSEIMCMDDMSMPKLKKLLLVQSPIIYSPISLRVSERLAKLRISQGCL